MPEDEAKALRGLLFDLDDTFLDRGRLSSEAYRSLVDLAQAGLHLMLVTGRPAGWGRLLARMWPVDAAVSENGAILHRIQDGKLVESDVVPPDERARRRARLLAVAADLQSRFPELRETDDARDRISDVTLDIGEHVHVDARIVEEAVSLAGELGATCFTSSVHLHLTFDRHDKATGSLGALASCFGTDSTLARQRYAYVGDSENDAACFAAYSTTVGVANLSGRPTVLPRYVTHAERADGFVELARALVEKRRA
jgi:HAD superfamily hydrolase (TIGR01484 family)